MFSVVMFIVRLISVLVLFSGCGLLIIPIEHALYAAQSRKDVSSDPERGYIIGKQYFTLNEIILYQYRCSNELKLGDPRIINNIADESERNETYVLYKKINKGTIITITQLFVKTCGWSELPVQYIYAQFEFEGNIIEANVSVLFTDRYQSPEVKWIFTPEPKFLIELDSQPDIARINHKK